jgi:transcriptional regulator with XRE-family HTH domain
MTGNKLRLLREFRNYSQDYVAKKLGITQNTYSRVENNQTRITTERLHQIAQILNVPVGELVSNEELVIQCRNSLPNNQPVALNQEHWKELLENTRQLYKEIISGTNEKIALLESEIQELRQEKNKMLQLIEKLRTGATV